MKKLLLISVLMHFCSQAAEIALTFDDAPRNDTAYFDGKTRTAKLIEGLRKADIAQVAFFCTTRGFNDAGKLRILEYIQTGHLVANHTHSHPKLDDVGPVALIKDIETAHHLLKDLPNFKPWFRYPFLNEGRTTEIRSAVRTALERLGYRDGYVTVDTYEWYMDTLFQKAITARKTVDFIQLEKLYVDTLWDNILFYDNVAKKVLKRSPKHVLLLHENDLAALFISSLVKRIREQGWKIISPEEAYQDPLVTEIPNHFRHGQGRLMAIALARGYEGPFRHVSEDESYLERLFEIKKIFH